MTVHPLRACSLCSDHQLVGAELLCGSPIVAGALRLVPCETARYGEGGGCGRDAHHMRWPPLQVPPAGGPVSWSAQ